jgi:predicted methyltransferase
MTSSKFGSRIAIGAALMLVSATVSAAPASNPASSRAMADPSRPEGDRAMDAARHPAKLLTFLHVKAGETIADVWPGDYWDRLFASLVGPKGKVYAVHLVTADKAEKVTTPAQDRCRLPITRTWWPW